MRKVSSCLAFLVLVTAGCREDLIPGGSGSPPYINLQVTEYKDAEAFERIVSELEARGIKATLLTRADFVSENCERFRDLQSKGFEVMAFARPEPQDGQSVTLSMLSYEEQEALIRQTKDAIEDCVGTAISGFRCTRFDQNEDTYAIMDSLGFKYNLGFVARTEQSMPGHENDVYPYEAPGYGFWAVPMHSAYFDGRWVAFCDNPFKSLVDAAGWGELLKSELDSMHGQGRPLLVEVHPYYSGVDEGAFEAFVSFLDYAQSRGARFISVAELVEGFVPPATGSGQGAGGGCSCSED